MYEEAMAHARDRLVLRPGVPATVPLRPRAVAASSGANAGTTSGGVFPFPAASGASVSRARSLSLASAPATARSLLLPAGQVAPGGLRREVFGFLPYWELTDPTMNLDFSLLSTIAYFQVAADANGHLVQQAADGTSDVGWTGWSSSRMTDIINQAHAAGTRVVLTVERFAWTTSQTAATNALLSSDIARQTLAGEIAAAVRARGADGVNLDFEPIPLGQRANFVTFVRQLRAALDATGPGLLLSYDTTGDLGNWDVASLNTPGGADYVVVMGYDYRTDGSGDDGSIDPLGGPRYDLLQTVTAYLGQTTADRVILALPYYGRAWSTVSSDPNAHTQPQNATYGYSASVPFDLAAKLAEQYGRQYDAVEQSAWFVYQRQNCGSCPSTWREVYYDDGQSIALKYGLVNQWNLRGAGIWALGYDGQRPEMAAAVRAAFVDTTPPNPSPMIVAVTPASVAAGSADVALTVTGANFAPGISAVTWNGQVLPTGVLSATQLAAQIPASLLATQGIATVAVVNGPPGGGTSQPVQLPITMPAAQLALSASPTVITYGGSTTLAASITGSGANRTVTLQRMAAKETTWTDVAMAQTDATGQVGFTYQPATNTQFRVSFAGAPDLGPGESAPVRVVVRQLVLLRPTGPGQVTTVPRGTKVKFTATVRPIGAGIPAAPVTFAFYRMVGGHWALATKRTATADAGGRAATTFAFTLSGSWYVQGLVGSTPTGANNRTPIERYRVP
jgi:spore germination protein YaaH